MEESKNYVEINRNIRENIENIQKDFLNKVEENRELCPHKTIRGNMTIRTLEKMRAYLGDKFPELNSTIIEYEKTHPNEIFMCEQCTEVMLAKPIDIKEFNQVKLVLMSMIDQMKILTPASEREMSEFVTIVRNLNQILNFINNVYYGVIIKKASNKGADKPQTKEKRTKGTYGYGGLF